VSLSRSVQLLIEAFESSGAPCEIEFASGEKRKLGDGAPAFRLKFHSDHPLRWGMDELALAEAYIKGEIDIEGDMISLLDLRLHLLHKARLPLLFKFWSALLLRNPLWTNRAAIVDHYSFGDDFYLSFTDKKYHFYSHGYFHRDDETLEEASEHKLETMFKALKLGPEKRLLDIGGGWGAVTKYCGNRGVSVTSVTIADDSYNYTSDLIAKEGYENCVVLKEDFLDHQPAEPYDGVVIYGVIEHIPYYRRFYQQVWDILKPGGRFYLDASAALRKFEAENFTRKYIWHGPHSFMCLQDVIQELLYNGLRLLHVENDQRSYELTMRHWAARFTEKKDEIIARWGQELYRLWHLYLWAGSHAFKVNSLQAYHLVAERRTEPGPRPGLWARTRDFIRAQAS